MTRLVSLIVALGLMGVTASTVTQEFDRALRGLQQTSDLVQP